MKYEKITLIKLIKKHELLYRIGEPIIEDKKFDELKEKLREIDPNNEVLIQITGEKFSGEKRKLSKPMGSLINIKNEEELNSWIIKDEHYIITPKLDGVSVLRNKDGFTSRGDDGIEGYDITKYCKFTNILGEDGYFRGEIVISKNNLKRLNQFRLLKGEKEYKTPRSAVVGLLQSDYPDVGLLTMLDIIPFQYFDTEELEINSINYSMINKVVISGKDMNHDKLSKLFHDWNNCYEIDGLVITLNSRLKREELGFETNSFNPKWGRAYKNGFEEEGEAYVMGIKRHVSKSGTYTPVLEITKTILCNNDITSVNVDNERFILYYGIGVGNKIKLKKSGNVIPRLTEIEGIRILPQKEFEVLMKKGLNDEEFRRHIGADETYNL